MHYPPRLRVRESATYLVDTGEAEQAAYLLRLLELADGRWTVNLMVLPRDSRVADNTFATVEQACAAADRLYAMSAEGERWEVRRWGWDRPGCRPDPAPRHGSGRA